MNLFSVRGNVWIRTSCTTSLRGGSGAEAANVCSASTHARKRNCNAPTVRITKHCPDVPNVPNVTDVQMSKLVEAKLALHASYYQVYVISNLLKHGYVGNTLMSHHHELEVSISQKLMPTTAFQLGTLHPIIPDVPMHGYVMTKAVISVQHAVDALFRLHTTWVYL